MFYRGLMMLTVLIVISCNTATGQILIPDVPSHIERWTQPLGSHLERTLSDAHNPAVFSDSKVKVTDDLQGHSYANVSGDEERDGRLLSVFTLVQFANTACTAGDRSGTCYTGAECVAYGGEAVGTCARGFGKCCYKAITCGGTSSMNCTYLASPNYPGTYNEARTCSMSFTRTSGICQLRLDFESFDSVQPNELGVCNEDQFTVPGERKFDYLCGTAPSNWHFYLDVDGKDNPTVFNFATSSTSFNRRFKIKVSMIGCNANVPSGCGQYFTGNSGSIQSFNFGSYYLADVDYGICLRKEKNRCTTTFTTSGQPFVLCPDLYKLPVGQGTTMTLPPTLNVLNMYCQINTPFASLFTAAATIPSPLTSVTNGPIIIWHRTTADALPNWRSLAVCPSCAGFSQTFQHNSC